MLGWRSGYLDTCNWFQSLCNWLQLYPKAAPVIEQNVLSTFSNVGYAGAGRSFPGFPDQSRSRTRVVEPRGAERLELRAGDLVSIDNSSGGDVLLAAFDERGDPALASLGLEGAEPLPRDALDTAQFDGWIGSNGGCGRNAPGCRVPGQEDPVVLRATLSSTVWVFRPSRVDDLVAGALDGTVCVTVQPASGSEDLLPPPLGAIREEFTVTRGTARAYELRAGELVQIIDVEGQQCSDFQACRLAGLDAGREAFIDTTATRSMVRRAYPGPGLFDKFFDGDLSPLLRVVQDTCGRHDTFGMACTARGYEERGFPGHLNCSDNISAALDLYGVARRPAWPAINFFWSTWFDPHHQILTEESHSRPGDYVALQAIDDLACVTTACPDDIDPINGWNPTDVHVRIYRPDAPIQRAVAYRPKEDAPMLLSQPSAFHDRLTPLTEQFAPARDLWSPVSFPSVGTIGEYWACRNAVTLQDMSGLRKFDVVGPDAERVLQMALTRDIAKLSVWRGTYALMCDEAGTVIDDGTLFRLGPQLFRWCCGSEESGRVLQALIDDNGWQARITDMRSALPNLALQGPKSRDLLRDVIFTQPHVPNLEQLKWFGVTVARIGDRTGAPFMLSRSGYTGELGYELFCAKSDALEIWDALVSAGAAYGLEPMGSAALETIRIEAGLAAANAEFAPGVDAYEAGLGFAVDLNKSDFVGKDALARNATAPRRVLKALMLDGDDVPLSGAPVFRGERQVGEVTSATRSPMLERAVALARLGIEVGENGTVLEVGQLDGRMKRLSATVADTPMIDPKRTRARA